LKTIWKLMRTRAIWPVATTSPKPTVAGVVSVK